MNDVELTVESTEEKKESAFSNQPVFWQIVVLMVVLITIFSSAIATELSQVASDRDSERTRLAKQTPQQRQAASVIQSAGPKENLLAEVEVLAQSAVVWDVKNQKFLYSKNENKVLPLASVTKLMTSLLANELLESDSNIHIDREDVRQYGDSGLMNGETFTLEELNGYTLMTSSNDGAYALASTGGAALGLSGAHAFTTAMNVRAEQLGLDSLNFLNPTGLDIDERQAGAFGSATDIAKLTEYIIEHRPEILEATTEDFARVYNQNGEYHNAQNTNGTVDDIAGLIGSKTGYTDLAGGNLMVAFEAGINRPIVVVVLGSTRTGRFEDVLELVATTKAQLSQ